MRTHRLFQTGDYQPGEHIRLDKNASQHLIKVLRYREGDTLVVFNGKGNSFVATLNDVSAGSATVVIGENASENPESSLKLHLVLALSKGERMDFAIQKAVEAGVTEISPVISERSVVRLDEKRKKSRLLHWQGIVQHACEQSGRTFIPPIHSVIDLATAVKTLQAQTRLVLDPLASQGLREIEHSSDVILLVGPEGGLAQDEVDIAIHAGYEAVKLGPRIFRTETACVAACVALQTLWGDLA
jgi:16S rRNA (uracil1498-N3)-methyltransferase